MASRFGEAQTQDSRVTPRRVLALPNWLALALILMAAAIYLWPIAAFSDDTDEGVYWQSLRAMASGHPLFSSVFSSQAPLFLPSLYPFYLLFGQTIAAARAAVVVYALVGIVAIYWLGAQIGGKWGGLIAAALLTVDYHYALQGRTLQADAPAVALEILAVAIGVAASRRFGRSRLALAALTGVAVALATLMKLTEICALVPIAVYLGAPLLRAFDGGEGRIQRPSAAGLRIGARATALGLGMVAVGGLITTGIVLAPFASDLSEIWRQAVTFHLAAAHLPGGSLTGNLRVIIREARWAGLTAALALGIAYWRRDWRMGPPLLWLIASTLILLRQFPLFDHIAILIVPCLALMSSLAPAMLGPVTTKVTGRWLSLGFAVLTCAVFAGGLYSAIKTTAHDAARQPSLTVKTQLAAIEAYTAPGETIITDDQYAAASIGRNVPPELVDTSYVRVASGFLTASQVEAILARDNVRVVVFATGRLNSAHGLQAWLSARSQVVDLGGSGRVYLLTSGQGAG
ncbi:MAG TPA: glycosyltransferase family 39 protein [Ktedonobacterales bacterium]